MIIRKCECKDYQENMRLVDAPFALPTIGGYTGKPFVCCPWCGKKLEVTETDEQIKSSTPKKTTPTPKEVISG